MKIVTTPDKILIGKASPVTTFDKKLGKIIEDMKKTLDATRDPVGVGLAAPQVGISKRIFLARPVEKGEIFIFINPEITQSTDASEIPSMANSNKVESKKPKKSRGKLLEGCLSVPNIWGNVARRREIEIKYQDIKGKEHIENFSGFMAVIIQHEVDHLNGILFTKHVLAQKEQLYRSHKNEKNEDVFEEIEI